MLLSFKLELEKERDERKMRGIPDECKWRRPPRPAPPFNATIGRRGVHGAGGGDSGAGGGGSNGQPAPQMVTTVSASGAVADSGNG